MARNPQPPERDWTADSLRLAIRKLKRRLADVEAFEPSNVKARNDPKIEALEAAIAETLVDVFGSNTGSYRRYQAAATLDTAGINMNGTPFHEITEGLVHGKGRAIELLGAAIRMLTEKLEDDFGESLQPDPRIAQAGVGQAGAMLVGYGGSGSGYNVGPYGYGTPDGKLEGVQARGVAGDIRVSIQNDTPTGGVIIADSPEARYSELQARVTLLETSLDQLRSELAAPTRRQISIGHNQGPDFEPVPVEELDNVGELIVLLKQQGPVPPPDPTALIQQSKKAAGVSAKIKQYLDAFTLEALKGAGGEIGKRLAQAPFWIAVYHGIDRVTEILTLWLTHAPH